MERVEWAGLAATALVAALLYAVSGFGFAVLATPLFLLLVEPARAIQLVIILSTALSIVVVPGLWRAVAPGLLLRLALGSLAGLPLGVIAFRHADAVLVRGAVGATILVFAAVMAVSRHRGGRHWAPLAMTPGRDFAAGAISGIATALVGMAGPPVLFYLLLTGAGAEDCARDAPLVFFAFVRSNAGGPCRDDWRPQPDFACSRRPEPLRISRRLRRPAARRSPRRRSLCHPRDRAARGGRALHDRCGRRGACYSPAMRRRCGDRGDPDLDQ